MDHRRPEWGQGGVVNIDAVLADALTRVREQVPAVVGDLDEEDLAWRPDPDANSIAWLIWHLTRVADDHVAEVAGTDQVWTSDGWYQRFGASRIRPRCFGLIACRGGLSGWTKGGSFTPVMI